MSISVSFGNIAKRRNSTLQGSFSASYNVVLKENCRLDRPVFLVSASSMDYNAAKWDTRYYFIDDVVSIRNNQWEVHCILDVLATYKSEILNTTAYVLYDSVANTELPDNRLPIKTTKTVQTATAACPFVPDGGTFILSLTGSNDTTGVYKVSSSDIASLIDDLSDINDNLFNYSGAPTKPSVPSYGADFLENIWLAVKYWTDDFMWYVEYIKHTIGQVFGTGNIPENIRECRFIPFDVGTTTGNVHIHLGTFETNQYFGKLNTETVHRTTNVSIPWQANDFRRRSPYTEIYLYLPYIGMIKLSSENLTGINALDVAYTLALRDGSLICTVSGGGEVLGQFSGNVGASVPIGFSNINLPKAAQSVISGVSNALNKNIGGAGMAAINFGNAITPNFTSIGGLDGVAGTAANQNITCYTVFHDTIDAPNQNLQIIGAPTMRSKSLASLTGFCQCMDAHVSAIAEMHALEEIDSLLNSGIYIE